jgi:hypothetical protein
MSVGGIGAGQRDEGLAAAAQGPEQAATPPAAPAGEPPRPEAPPPSAQAILGALLHDLAGGGLAHALQQALDRAAAAGAAPSVQAEAQKIAEAGRQLATSADQAGQAIQQTFEQIKRNFAELQRQGQALREEARQVLHGGPGTTSTESRSEARDEHGRLVSRESRRTSELTTDRGTTTYEAVSTDRYDRRSVDERTWEHGKGTYDRGASYAERHDRSVSLRSTPAGGESADRIGDASREAVLGGRELYKGEGRAEADATYGRSQGAGQVAGRYGTLEGDYDVRVLQAHAEASGGVTVTDRGLVARGEARVGVNLIDARGHVGYETPAGTVAGVPFNGRVDANVHAQVGAEAHARGELVVDPLHGRVYAGGDVGASAVARIEGDATASVQFTGNDGRRHSIGSVGVTGYASAGAEAAAHAHIGFDRGKVSFDLGAGLAWGLGAGASVHGEIDLNEVKNAALDGLDNLTGGAVSEARSLWHRASSLVSRAGEGVSAGLAERAKSTILGWLS